MFDTAFPALMTITAEQGFGLRVEQGRMLRGWTLAMQGHTAESVMQICQGLVTQQRVAPKVYNPYFLSLLVEAYGQAGQPEAGLEVLAEALTLVNTTEA